MMMIVMMMLMMTTMMMMMMMMIMVMRTMTGMNLYEVQSRLGLIAHCFSTLQTAQTAHQVLVKDIHIIDGCKDILASRSRILMVPIIFCHLKVNFLLGNLIEKLPVSLTNPRPS